MTAPVPWARFRFKRAKVWARVDDEGRPLVEGGRVEIRYKEGDARTYQASPRNLAPLGEEPPPSASGVRSTRRSDQRKRTARPAPEGLIEAWTDGACTGNPGPAGWGAVLRFGEEVRELSGFLGRATNNIAELWAVKASLEAVRDRTRPVRVYTDSTYTLGILTRDWKPKANQALVAEIRALLGRFDDVEVVKVPGHAGVPENERADELARGAIPCR